MILPKEAIFRSGVRFISYGSRYVWNFLSNLFVFLPRELPIARAMSTQSGITASPKLLSSFREFLEGSEPILTAEIVNESVQLGDIVPGSSLSSAFDNLRGLLHDSKAQYVVVKHGTDGNVCTFISYVPDYAAVKDKMLYASSKNMLIRQLGPELFPHILFLNSLEDVTYDHWKYSVSDGSHGEVMSAEEKELQEINEREFDTKIQSTLKKPLFAPANSLNFKIHDNAADVTVEEGQLYSFNIDLNTEEVFLSNSAPVKSAKELPSLIASDYPQYTIARLNGKTFFIFSCPSGSKVKERMIYASNKNSLINHFKRTCGIDKSLEAGDAGELELSEFEARSEDPAETPSALKFSRPPRAGRRR